MDQHRNELIKAHLKAVAETNGLILKGDVNFQDFATPSSEFQNDRIPKYDMKDFSPILISALSLNCEHSGRILIGRIITPPLIMKSVMTYIEDDRGCVVKLAVYNGVPSNLKREKLISAAKMLLVEGDMIGIVAPFYKRFMDGTEGIRLDYPSKLLTKLNLPEDAASSVIGSSVILRGLKSRPELNGSLAVVEEPLSRERVRVRIVSAVEAGTVLSVRIENIEISAPTTYVPSAAAQSDKHVLEHNADLLDETVSTGKSEVLEKITAMKEQGNELLRRGAHLEALQVYQQALSAIDDAEECETGQDEGGLVEKSSCARASAGRRGKGRARGGGKPGRSTDTSAVCAASRRSGIDEPQLRGLRAPLLSNCSLAQLRLGEAAEALSAACRALIADAGSHKARLRRAEAALALGLGEAAARDLAGCSQCGPGEESLRARVSSSLAADAQLPVVCVTPADLAAHLLRARPGTTLRLSAGAYAGPFSIDQEVCLVGPEAGCGEAVLDTRGSPAATVQVCVSGRVALSRLTVLHGEVPGHDELSCLALHVVCGAVAAHGCTFSSAAGPSVGAKGCSARLALWECVIRDSAAGGLLVDGGRAHCLETAVRGSEASGVEVRMGGKVVLERCRVSGNGKQGVLVWAKGGGADVRDCDLLDNRSPGVHHPCVRSGGGGGGGGGGGDGDGDDDNPAFSRPLPLIF